MLDALYAIGQALCLLGLAWGALLAIGTSETFTALDQASVEYRRRVARKQRDANDEDPHVSSLGYWP
jgi:hypothetical protein